LPEQIACDLSDITLGQFQRAHLWSLTAAAPSDSVFHVLCTN